MFVLEERRETEGCRGDSGLAGEACGLIALGTRGFWLLETML